jgi:Plasmid pRiA4b ORF-3-like protein
VTHPISLPGKRAGPPEDCGGPLGFSNPLDALADHNYADHEELVEWALVARLGGAYDYGRLTRATAVVICDGWMPVGRVVEGASC